MPRRRPQTLIDRHEALPKKRRLKIMTTKEKMEEIYEVSSFTNLKLKDDVGGGAVYIEQGPEEGLRIEAEPDFLRRIEVDVRSGTLHIRLGGNLLELLADKLTTSLTRPNIIYRIQVKQLQSADLACASELYINGLETQDLQLHLCGMARAEVDRLQTEGLQLKLSGMGSMHVSGTARHQNVWLSGAGVYAASDLLSESVVISISGSTRAEVNTSQSLDATIRGMGVVEYTGRPRVRQRIFGIGTVIRAGA